MLDAESKNKPVLLVGNAAGLAASAAAVLVSSETTLVVASSGRSMEAIAAVIVPAEVVEPAEVALVTP